MKGCGKRVGGENRPEEEEKLASQQGPTRMAVFVPDEGCYLGWGSGSEVMSAGCQGRAVGDDPKAKSFWIWKVREEFDEGCCV